MNTKSLPSQELLRQLLRYEPETGKLFWRKRTPDMFEDGKQSAEWRCKKWNRQYAGKEAFTAIDGQGYKHGRIFNVGYTAHRIIWRLVYGTEPPAIDHEKGNRTDNRIEELRESDHSDNMRNQKRRSTNTSGVTGVYWVERRKKWLASICVRSKLVHLGYFLDFDEAVSVRKAAEAEHGYHENHGRV